MYKKVLVPLDGSELAECVLPHVEAIVSGCGVQEVIFLRVVEPLRLVTEVPYIPSIGDDVGSLNAETMKRIDAESKEVAENYLDQLADKTKYNGVTIRLEVMTGKAADSITEYATQNGIDLIIIATHGRSGVSRWIWGSVADRVLRSADVPVLMIRPSGCVPGI